jgi:hypothetical protein
MSHDITKTPTRIFVELMLLEEAVERCHNKMEDELDCEGELSKVTKAQQVLQESIRTWLEKALNPKHSIN